MQTIAIIGAGQLGSRHLQGLKLSIHNLDIWVVDPSTISLQIAEERYNAIDNDIPKSVHFVTDIELLPSTIDVAIVASSSKPRLSICKALASHAVVKYLILEKFLFTSLHEYDEAATLLAQYNIKTWVNCPRRLFAHYDKIAAILQDNAPISMSIEASNWGMCCNSIHIIDIFMKLCGETSYSIDFSHVNPQFEESKRVGYIEFYGTEIVSTPKGSNLTLICNKEEKTNDGIRIEGEGVNICINEAKQKMCINSEESTFKMPFQSELTGKVVDSILQTGNCALTTYEESATLHKTYLAGLLDIYNKATGEQHDSCPIT